MILLPLVLTPDEAPIPIETISPETFAQWRGEQSDRVRSWVDSSGFAAEAGRWLILPAEDGSAAALLLCVGDDGIRVAFSGLPLAVPEGTYRFDTDDGETATAAALGWAIGGYRFTRYRDPTRSPARLVWPEASDRDHVVACGEATYLARDLINTPAGDMGPAELTLAVQEVAGQFGATFHAYVGDELLSAGFPMVHAVGRASSRAPRVAELRWGNPDHPTIAVVGKGVCFDTGGLDLKPSAGMLLMKKDMGGAANALALCRMIMSVGLPVYLRLLIPAVDNAVSGNAFRPLDVLRSRKGLTVEIGNTDAEGRLIMADALTAACEETPSLLVDFATLTGAARVALGGDLPALFCNDDDLAADLANAAAATGDPLWRMPLWRPYGAQLKSSVADLSNVGEGSFAGAVTAALFLERFVERGVPWAHLDLYAWNAQDRPGRPKGGEAMGARAVFAAIASRIGA